MRLSPWVGCALPGAEDFIDIGNTDVERLELHDLYALAKTLGVLPLTPDGQLPSEEVIRKEIKRQIF